MFLHQKLRTSASEKPSLSEKYPHWTNPLLLTSDVFFGQPLKVLLTILLDNLAINHLIMYYKYNYKIKNQFFVLVTSIAADKLILSRSQ